MTMVQPTVEELVTLTIDGKEVQVPKGTNLIQAAKAAGIEVPYYCYHPHLSVPGNCRMCQLEVEGAPKLVIGCHATATDGMKVSTHNTSKKVEDAQASTLEMLLINHPLDCTVCDQAGHCKLQDYHYEYNARPSRFLETKEQKVKAEPLGPTVILDGERCIACTRCVRFCDEVTESSEIGLLNRGDRYVIAVKEGFELNNALSGTVVDLCPVGALTHRKWRFNTRLWYSKSVDSICTGCSTGCNVKVHVRDKKIVQVKARLNGQVNKEWLCDEGRYGFDRFLPTQRFVAAEVDGKQADVQEARKAFLQRKSEKAAVFFSPDLLLEDQYVLQEFCRKLLSLSEVVLAYRERDLTEVEKILVSPDYASNFRSAQFLRLSPESTEQLISSYDQALEKLREGSFDTVYFIGDRALNEADQRDPVLLNAINQVPHRIALLSDRDSPLAALAQIVLPVNSVLERSGMMINRTGRLQYLQAVLEAPKGSEPIWKHLNEIARLSTGALVEARSDRDLTRTILKDIESLRGLSIAELIAEGGKSVIASAGTS